MKTWSFVMLPTGSFGVVLHRFPPKYRAVVHLYYYEGYAQEEIAQILGITRTAVQTRMSRARIILEKELKI